MGLASVAMGAEWTGGSDLFALLEKKYGLIDPAAQPQVARVYQVFERVQDVADKRGNRMPQLSVVNQEHNPWAIALPDGNILLSLAAIRLCYRNVTPSAGDARIAFVIGHELAHLAKNDFWDMEVYLAIAGGGQAESARAHPTADQGVTRVMKRVLAESARAHPTADPASEAERRQRRAAAWSKETEADDLGFLYAGLSGYPVHTLFQATDTPQDNFFLLWTSGARNDAVLQDLHPPPEERAAFLRSRLARLAEEIGLFRLGLRLAHFGACEQAVFFWRHFLQIFPAREVYNNLGACHLQRAQQTLPAAASYWLPVLFDAASRAEPLLAGQTTHPAQESNRALPPVLPDKAGHDLEQAVEYLEQAAAADAGYLPARLNLATAHFYRGEIFKARAALEEAVHIAPQQQEVAGWHALLLYLDNQENGLGDAALPHLTRLASQANAPLSLIFNQAILSQKKGRHAKSQWARLAHRVALLPAPYAQAVCRAARLACPPATARQKRLPWPLPVQPGTDLDTLHRDPLFAGWQTHALGWLQGRQQGMVYRRGEEAEVLALDGYVTMVVLRGHTLGGVQELRKKAGNPLHVRLLAEGEVWSYGSQWAVLVRDGRVCEAWVIRTGVFPGG